ncbi:helix-turn-helix domain-containing protein [Aerococcaceae bacterium NML190938]|nr:helix-turn-helix domain-containing protein [Aerococcaceae bacterium NML190938]
MFLRRIRDLREDHDLKQIEIAQILNVTQSTYSDYERGVLDISLEALITLSNYYQVSVDYLLELTDEKTRNQ